MSILDEIEQSIVGELGDAIKASGLVSDEGDIPAIILEKPKVKAHGDYATNIALQLSKVIKKPPRAIAETIVSHIHKEKANIQKIEIAGPGFINLFMVPQCFAGLPEHILKEGDAYGRSNIGHDYKIQVEFVSANPTGDLHLGHARGAAYGDALCNVLEAAGYDVQREYYINDYGNQIHNLALSVEARYMQALGKDWEVPEDGYHGKDIIEIGQKIAEEDGEKWVNIPQEERLSYFREFALKYELAKIRKDLEDFGVRFDNWFSESSLYADKRIEKVLDYLWQKDMLYKKDGAVWLRSTVFGDDKDRVVVKSDGSYTYFTPDIAYHKNKLERGFQTLINIWGADHHGYIPRMKAAIQALGYPADTLEVLIIQMVSLYEGGEKVKMSKRSGKALTLRQLMEEVGVDAMRYYFNTRSSDSHLDFDLDLARSQSNDNPVYYVQYAHARICTLLEHAKEWGIDYDGFDPTLLTHEKEIELLKKLGEFPQVVAEAAEKRMPHKVTQYVYELAYLLHSYYNAEKVLDESAPDLMKARLALMAAVKITIANALRLIGVSAPEKM
jgi:arginyl-tRNA synthetase (EC 6.1.1.19)